MPSSTSAASRRSLVAAVVRGEMTTLSRELKDDKDFRTAFFKSQGTESLDFTVLTDTKLICDGGIILVHAVLLEAVSPLFRAVFESQGSDYLLTRDVHLPDVSVGEMQKVMQLIYTGSVNMVSEVEVKSLKKVLAYLQIDNLGDTEIRKICRKKTEILPEIRVRKISKFETGIKSEDEDSKNAVVDSVDLTSDKEKMDDPDTQTTKTKAGKKVKRAVSKAVRNYNDSDYEPPTSDEESAEAVKSPDVPKSSHKPSSTKGVDVSNSKDSGSNGSSNKLNSNTQKPSVAAVIPSRKSKNKNADSDNETDWREPNYNDKTWFDREARRCQFCKKDHENPAQASMCITGHHRLRCYFCFTVYKNTEKLFEHFKNQHKQAGRENCLLCPYCEQTIPLKSVSCHVISLHLSNPESKSQTPKVGITVPYRPQNKANGRPPMPVVVVNRTSSGTIKNKLKKPENNSASPKKGPTDKSSTKKRKLSMNTTSMERTKKPKHGTKDDDGLIRVSDMDVTIRRKGLDNKIWVWRIQKKYLSSDIV